ncbi:ArsR/SmtB family transcription factor [Halomarina rubra]|uniref:ArsR/SmtB family transcription factor n=1 Tax=Halomarina rubra TaxID=2071873 RepID=A0ABD6AV13_9EURY|nr:helix-turn-helix domain-containing protein [Halomarina rubra]
MNDEVENPFSLLADETRLGIVEAIGDASGDGEYVSLPYSAIQAALGDHDAGNLNYHLRKLKARFVERTDDGYRLTVPGIRVYQAISSGQFDGDRPTVPPTELDADCDECGAPLLASYEDGRFFVHCSDCDIMLHRYPVSPNSFDPDDVEDLVRTANTRIHLDFSSMVDGICPYCSGTVDHDLSTDDRVDAGVEERDVFAHLTCRVCGWFNHLSVEMVAFHHPVTVVFFERRGVPEHYLDPVVPGEWTTTVPSTDPWRVEVTIDLDGAEGTSPVGRDATLGTGDTLRLVVDGALDVVEWAVLE